MTRRFPRSESLILNDLLARLIDNGRASEEQDRFDPFPVVKLFTPDAAATWLLTEAIPKVPTSGCSASAILALGARSWAI